MYPKTWCDEFYSKGVLVNLKGDVVLGGAVELYPPDLLPWHRDNYAIVQTFNVNKARQTRG